MACSVVIRDLELSCLSRFEEAFLTHTEPATELIEFEIRNLKPWCSDPNLSQFFFFDDCACEFCQKDALVFV